MYQVDLESEGEETDAGSGGLSSSSIDKKLPSSSTAGVGVDPSQLLPPCSPPLLPPPPPVSSDAVGNHFWLFPPPLSFFFLLVKWTGGGGDQVTLHSC